MTNLKIGLNDGWDFAKEWDSALSFADASSVKTEKVSLPHTVAVTPYNCFDESIYQMLSGYRRVLSVPADWKGKRILLTIDGAAHDAELFVNGQSLSRHRCGYTAFTTDITEALIIPESGTSDNVLAVRLDSRESLDIPPFGNVIDYMTYGGLTRSVTLEVRETDYLRDVFVMTPGAADKSGPHHLRTKIRASLSGRSLYEIEHVLLDAGGREVSTVREKYVPDADGVFDMEFNPGEVQCWDIRHPILYSLKTRLFRDGVLTDETVTSFGFREVSFTAEGFFLNGKRLKLRGLNRHQCFPYVGYAMPERLQREDADILKYELGLNAVRTSHYPDSQYFLDECDRIGLLVFTEIPGWQHIGGGEWKEQACENVREMIQQDRNHPSIFLWGVRINESQDDDEFYKKTNEIAHSLDESRPTGGVRFLRKSHLFEDVYTYNDFLHSGTNAGCALKKDVTPDLSKGYLISEYNGHMYPGKSFDCEEHRTQHVLRYLRVLSDASAQRGIAGSFAWCFFDYNTHRDFGSGDRICYHGVCDMFRNPKDTAYVYASQSDLRPVLHVASTMDIGEHPGGYLPKVYALTNADSIRLYKNDEFVKEFFPDHSSFAGLKHPPVIIDDFVGELITAHEKYTEAQAEEIKSVLKAIARYGQNDLPLAVKARLAKMMLLQHMTVEEGLRLYYAYVGNWGGKVITWRFEAVREGKSAESVVKSPAVSHSLEITVGARKGRQKKDVSAAGDIHLLAPGDTYDAESIRLRMLDQNGSLMPYFQEGICLACSGSVSLIGPDCTSLRGGMGGTYVRTNGQKGEGTLSITCEGKTEEVHFLVQ